MTTGLTPEFDLFAASGKRTGFIRLPHSVHRSAYGFIPIPVAVIATGEGPSVLLMAGNHGDEYEGQVALGNLIRSLQPGQVSYPHCAAHFASIAGKIQTIYPQRHNSTLSLHYNCRANISRA